MRNLSLVVVLFCSGLVFGQQQWNSVSLELGYGYVSPSNLLGSNLSDPDRDGFNHVDAGIRVMIDKNIGVKLQYSNDNFVQDSQGVDFNTFTAAAVYNVGSLFNLTYATNETFGLLGHAGLGVTFSNVKQIGKTERIGTIALGLTPEVKIIDRIAIYGDFTYAFRLKQHYGFDGVLLSPDYTPQVGKTAVFSLGLHFYLGQQKRHADWY